MSLPAPEAETADFFRKCLGSDPIPFIEKMNILGEFLYEMNRQVNLTAIKEDRFWNLHAADSLSPALYFPELFSSPHRIADLGCGAGFPSLVLAAAFPEIQVTAIDSTRKKIDFVNQAAAKMGLANLEGVHGRGNELARKPPFKNGYDAVFARAVASADVLIRETAGFIGKKGSLIVFRTPEQYDSELDFLKKWNKGTFRSTEIFELPGHAGRRLFLQMKQMREMH